MPHIIHWGDILVPVTTRRTDPSCIYYRWSPQELWLALWPPQLLRSTCLLQRNTILLQKSDSTTGTVRVMNARFAMTSPVPCPAWSNS